MPESLTLRNLQLPASNSAPLPPSGALDNADAIDFQMVLAQQLGGASPAEKLPQTAEAAVAPGSEVDDEAADAAVALPLDPVGAALQLTVPPSGVVSLEGLNLRRVAPEREQGWDTGAAEKSVTPGKLAGAAEESVASGKLAGADVALTTATFAAGTDEAASPRVLTGPEHDATQSVSELRPEPAPTQSMERRAEVSPQHAPKGVGPLDQPVSMARQSFASDLGDRVLWMASNSRQVAELRIDPPQLGPVEVRLSINGEQASLNLVSANAGVREALQASIPRLQDMIQSIGLELGSVTVGSESFSRQREQAEHHAERYPQEQADSTAVREPVAWSSRPVLGRGLVDIFA